MQQRFLLQILLLAQHVSGTTMPIIGSSRVLYSGCYLCYLVLWFSSCWSGVELRVICPFAGCCSICWRLYVTMETLWQQKYITGSVYDCTVEDVEYIYNKLIIRIQQQKYSHRLNLL